MVAFVPLLRLRPMLLLLSLELLTSKRTFPPIINVLMPLPVLLLIAQLSIETLVVPVVVSSETPCVVKPSITTSSKLTELAASTLTPLMPVAAPLIERPRNFTDFLVSAAAVILMITPFVPAARIEPCVSSQSIMIDFVMVTAP